MRCPECRGRGTVKDYLGDVWDCATCRGSGDVTLPDATHLKRRLQIEEEVLADRLEAARAEGAEQLGFDWAPPPEPKKRERRFA